MSFSSISKRIIDGFYWVSIDHDQLGHIDGRGATEAMAMAALKANIRAAVQAHNDQRYDRFCERYPDWRKQA